MPNPRPIAERFAEKYEVVPFSGCWIWNGATGGKGYGYITYEQGSQGGIGAHRVSWMLHRGVIPKGMYVCHKCDVPACVNPDHLFLGTNQDNVADCIAKGRKKYGKVRFGEAITSAKLTESAVIDIRKKRMVQKEYAKLYGVSQGSIRNVQRGRTWKHVPPSH